MKSLFSDLLDGVSSKLSARKKAKSPTERIANKAGELWDDAAQSFSDAVTRRLSVPVVNGKAKRIPDHAAANGLLSRFQSGTSGESSKLLSQGGIFTAAPLADAPPLVSALSVLAVAFALGFKGAPLHIWAIGGIAALLSFGVTSPFVWIPYGALVAIFNVPVLRKQVSKGIMQLMETLQFLPTISETEQIAIEAGNTWMDAELFSGRPNLHKLLSQPYPDITEKEREFLEGPVEEVCKMTSDWEVMQRGDLSPEVWDYLREKKFFGMIVPEEYDGLGFSATANSAVVQKLAAHSLPLSITVMVPNSLGPAELLVHYGTDEQKEYYLPRLARGEIIPAFALTEPQAGSDAGAMTSTGEVFKKDDGELWLRLNWNKRYISLAAISDVLGMAFKLHDPENHLGKGEDLGITCALIPTDSEGVKVDTRHDPLGIPFYNSPTTGEDVEVPIDAIIGGVEGAGQGWKMLMESLSAGRGISLPAQATGGAKYVTRVAGAHAAVRQQFGLSIGKFEGIEEPLARIAGWTYLMEAGRRYTTGAIDSGAKPAVVTAIAKYNFTELQRDIVNDGMDILAGNAISRGPRNLLAHGYQGLPISITVEGANILTRTLMIFGQGAIRCHPYAYDEIKALMERDLDAFDSVFWKHVGHVINNGFRSFVYSITRAKMARSPVTGEASRYWQKLTWASASFAFLADLTMGALGGELKRKEKITGRFADILSWMYLATATLRRFEAEGEPEEHKPYFHWAMQYSFARIQEGFDGLYENLEIPGLTLFFRYFMAPYSRLNPIGAMPDDDLGGIIAQGIQEKDGAREWLSEGVFVPDDVETPLGRLENAFRLSREEYHIGQKLKDAVRRGDLPKKRLMQLLDEAVEKGIITQEERELVDKAEAARADYVKVDAFDLDEYRKNRPVPGSDPSPREKTRGDGAPPSASTPPDDSSETEAA